MGSQVSVPPQRIDAAVGSQTGKWIARWVFPYE